MPQVYAERPDVLKINFVVIGGGIAGLTSAISLTRAGHSVTVLEQSDDFDEVYLRSIRFFPFFLKLFAVVDEACGWL